MNVNVHRLISEKPIYSRYEGICSVCKKSYFYGEKISPYFDKNNNYWRHTSCLQLFYIVFKFKGKCKSCSENIESFTKLFEYFELFKYFNISFFILRY